MKELWIQTLAVTSYLVFGVIAYILNIFQGEKRMFLRRHGGR